MPGQIHLLPRRNIFESVETCKREQQHQPPNPSNPEFASQDGLHAARSMFDRVPGLVHPWTRIAIFVDWTINVSAICG
jgi:hypothetical protein